MQQVFSIALAAMQQDMQRLDRTALNLVNATTPGYKREIVAGRPFVEVVDALIQAGGPEAGALSGVTRAGGPALQVMHDLRPGTLRSTGEPLDMALTGEGFFEVETPDGIAYTRQGSFKVDARGRLTTAQGYPVMGKNGDIYLSTATPVIDEAGNITEQDATTGPSALTPGMPVAQLKVVRFDQPDPMERLGEGLMTAGRGLTVLGDAETHIRQGALENANVSTAQEMVQLMQAMRHFESMQKVAQGYDEMLGSAIRKLGELS